MYYRDPSEFKKRFEAYKNGKSVREIYGLPGYANGAVGEDPELDMIKKYEGWRDKTYLDSKGIPTIGWGFTDTSLVSKGKMSREEGDQYLQKIGNNAKKYLRNKLGPRIWDNLDTATKAALLSYHHNYPAGFGDNTRFMKHWRAGRYNEAVGEMDAGMNDPSSPGLRPRRLDEQAAVRKDSFLFPGVKSQKPVDTLIQKSDATRVASIPTIQQQTVPSTWMQQATELPRHTFVQNFEMAKPLSIQKLVDTIEEYTPTWDTFKNAYACGKLPRYQNGLTPQQIEDIIVQNQGTIQQGHRWSPLSSYANSTWRDYNKPFFQQFVEGGLGNVARGLQQQFESWNKEARGIGDLTDHTNVLLDLLTGAGGKVTKDSAKELIKNIKKAAKKAIQPAKVSVKKEIKTLPELFEHHKQHPEELKPLKSKVYDDIQEQVYKQSNYKQQKAGGKPLEFVKDEAYTAEFPSTVKTAAYHGPNGSVFDRVAAENMNKFKIMGPHEYHHLLEEQIKYTPQQASILEQAFPLSEEFKKAHPNFNYLRERAAMNSELAYAIGSKYGFPVGPEFDNVVRNMSPWELEEIASGLSAYNKDASAQRLYGGIDFLPKIPLKESLLKVPAGFGLYAGIQDEYNNGKLPEYSNGKIRIKPANRGKFNATKKRTGKTTEELTHSKNPLTRKRAIFAQNARKWKH